MFITPFSQYNRVDESTSIIANDDGGLGVNFSFFTSDDAKVPGESAPDNTKKKKTSKPKTIEVSPDVKLANPIPGADVAEVDYAGSYGETKNLLYGAIMQTDELSSEVKQDIDAVRASKTLKGKYTYLTNLTGTAASLITTKIGAIKELNSIITQAHNLNLNRMKTLKLNESAENDDMRMMDIYSAFVNTPVGAYTPAAPNIQDITLGVNNPAGTVSGVEMVVPTQTQNLTPEQNRMRMESNPNIQVVVRYDQSTGQRCFDVIDKMSGASVPNYPRPDNFLLEDTTIDVHAGIARNRNINTVWPLVVNGSNSFINEY